ncbi:ribonuclease Z [Flagellimonas allohymeniacidonis]|uniref:Ribonuclease Z n=1 Tax=Flagellimonas allohymeniacidonis TaxID=2517819 RepID=A0A4Q8QIP8_9FLAO|nr:ribonuclease Z [Allomuricauda hymeniacidonis]TAI48309.1 ribonuclease Z [Allomuricauda hymeniacidonis]
MKLTILGCYSATPRTFTNPTSQVLETKGHLFLIDCGEGTQVQLRKFKVKFSRINHIFISHLHGDHFFGLPGLVSTFRLLGRERELHIYGPKGIKEAITLLLKLGDSWTNFPLIFHELKSKDSEILLDDENIIIKTVPLYHRVYTNGFLFSEKPAARKLKIETVEKFGIDKSQYSAIKNGADGIQNDGNVIPNKDLTQAPPKPKSYAFCSDTVYNEEIVPLIHQVDTLYHESTFLQSEERLCAKTKHSTAQQAAKIAKKAEVNRLILGHYSTRYGSIELFRDEAKEIFPRVELADDGKSFEI